jgi:hypothetical protein
MAAHWGSTGAFARVHRHPITHIFFALLSTIYEWGGMAFIYALKINSLSVVIARILKQFWLYGREKCFENVASP